MAEDIEFGEIRDTATPKVDIPKPDHRASQDGIGPRVRRTLNGSTRRERETRAKAPKPPVPKQRPGYFVKPVEQLYGMLAMATMIKAPNTAAIIMKQSHECAVAWDQLAQKNDVTRRILMTLTQTSDWGMIAVAHAPILFAAMGEAGIKNPLIDMTLPSTGDEAEEYLREQNGE